MAEKLFQHAIHSESEPIHSLKVTSAGVFARDGDGPSPNAQKALMSVGIDLSNHKSRRLTQELIDRSIIILCMTKAHRDIIENEFNVKDVTILLVGKFLKSPHDIDVPDPFGQDLKSYKACRDNLVEAIPEIIQFLKKNYLCQIKTSQ